MLISDENYIMRDAIMEVGLSYICELLKPPILHAFQLPKTLSLQLSALSLKSKYLLKSDFIYEFNLR